MSSHCYLMIAMNVNWNKYYRSPLLCEFGFEASVARPALVMKKIFLVSILPSPLREVCKENGGKGKYIFVLCTGDRQILMNDGISYRQAM